MTQKRESRNQSKQQKHKLQIDPLFKDSTNIFIVQNPQIIPPMTEASKNRLKQALHSITVLGFEKKTKVWIDGMKQNPIEQMLIKIKQITTFNDIKKDNETAKNNETPKYSIYFIPVYKRVSFMESDFNNHKFRFITTFNNITRDPFRHYSIFSNWNFRLKQIQFGNRLTFYAPWQIQFKKKWGKPLNEMWVTDCRSFILRHFLKNDQRRVGRADPYKYDFTNQSVYLQMKGYDTRLKRSQQQQPGIYLNKQALKKIDFIETGYNLKKFVNNASNCYILKLGIGSNFDKVHYGKLLAKYVTNTSITKNIGLTSISQVGMIGGKNVIPHEMFSRNENRWMGDRSRIYVNQRFDIAARGISIFQAVKLIPLNYLSLWASRSYENKIKFQAQFGVSLGIMYTSCRFDISLFRLSGTKGEPRFGLKYQF